MERVGYVRVNLDQQIFLGGELLIADLDALLYPGSEVITDDAVGYVEDPLLLEPLPLELEGREIDLELRIQIHQLHDLTNRETFILWTIDMADSALSDV